MKFQSSRKSLGETAHDAYYATINAFPVRFCDLPEDSKQAWENAAYQSANIVLQDYIDSKKHVAIPEEIESKTQEEISAR